MKRVAITTGEPGGIGPEITLKAIFELKDEGIEFIPYIICDRPVIDEVIKITGLDIPSDTIIIDITTIRSYKKGDDSCEGGIASFNYIKKAVELALSKEVDAIITAPISKKSLSLANLKWHGHTEMLAELTGTREYGMMFYADMSKSNSIKKELRLILTTIHVPLREVPSMITEEKVLSTIKLAKKGVEMFGIKKPRILVSGLNPHAGEKGIMGREEEDIIKPAIEKAVYSGIDARGPYPPDTVFYHYLRDDFDIIVSMYHDHGLTPFKMLAFQRGVNITVGLPFIRTSPDHGTAYDIAWKRRADPSSMKEAIKLALRLRII